MLSRQHNASFDHLAYGILLSLNWTLSVSATNSTDHWMDVVPNMPGYNNLSTCAQSCLLGIDKTVGCWSRGCVCSEQDDRGPNVMHAFANVTACSRSCPSTGSSDTVSGVSNLFQEACQVSLSLDTSISVTTGQAPKPTQLPLPTPPFDPKTAVNITQPTTSYNVLRPCLRWLFNVCKSQNDTAENCHPDKEGDYTNYWQGLAVDMQCSSIFCLCGDIKFGLSAQRLFDNARIFCSVQPPTIEEGSPDFLQVTQMFTEYCSGIGGFVLAEMILSLHGQVPQHGLSTEAKIGIASAFGSAVVTAVFSTCAWKLVKKLRKI